MLEAVQACAVGLVSRDAEIVGDLLEHTVLNVAAFADRLRKHLTAVVAELSDIKLLR